MGRGRVKEGERGKGGVGKNGRGKMWGGERGGSVGGIVQFYKFF